MNRIGESCEVREKGANEGEEEEEEEEEQRNKGKNRARVCTSTRAVEMRRATFEILTTGILKKKRLRRNLASERERERERERDSIFSL